MVPKRDGTWRPCGDYRHLNEATIRDGYSLPHIHDCTACLAGSVIFSKIDLVKGYHQIPMHSSDVPKTAITMLFGLFEFLRMSFGLKNAAQTFQRLMDAATQDLPGVFVHLDDVLVVSTTVEEHIEHLRGLCEALKRFGLVSIFRVEQLEFLGHKVSRHGLEPLPEKVRAILDFRPPATIKLLQSFLGMINFYRRFVPGIAGVMRPLTDALTGNPRKLEWSGEMQEALDESKAKLAKATLLAHPDQRGRAPASYGRTDGKGSVKKLEHVSECYCQIFGASFSML